MCIPTNTYHIHARRDTYKTDPDYLQMLMLLLECSRNRKKPNISAKASAVVLLTLSCAQSPEPKLSYDEVTAKQHGLVSPVASSKLTQQNQHKK